MKLSPLRWVAIAAAAATAALCWYLLTMEPDATPRTAGKGQAQAAQVTGKGFVSSPAEPMPKFGTREFSRALRERAMEWLNARGRDPEGLVIVFDLTGEYILLEEAEEKFPEDLRVCLAVVQLPEVTWSMELIDHMTAVDPNNPEWLYRKLSVKKGNDLDAALTILRQAAGMKGRRDEHRAERMRNVRETSLALGVGPGDAVRLALGRPTNHTNKKALDAAREVLEEELASAKAAGSENRVQEIIDLGLSTAEKITGAPPISSHQEFTALTMKQNMLAGLPDDKMIGTSGSSVGSVRSQVNERLLVVKEEDNARSLLKSATDEVAITYFDLYLLSGEADAGVWLRQQAEPPK